MISGKYLYFIFVLCIIACKNVSQQNNRVAEVLVTGYSETPVKSINYKLIGTEPFWACEIVGDSVHFSNSEGIHVSQLILQEEDSLNFISENLRIKLLPVDCSDGMSERKYSFEAKVTLDSFSYEGCAFIIN